MSTIAIRADNISKLYRLGQIGTGTLSHDLNRWWSRLRGKEDPYLRLGEENYRDKGGGEWVWVLKDVSFEVKQGEVLGIIGKNGAGKSTLLKLLSRVTTPSTGRIRANGRIASLLEVGTGFHPELTGRENIFLNGAILGMTKTEIKRKFDEIVDFSGVERYIDTPVKRYSSGMYVRLAFAVAAHLEPEILIIDEVLAVGDAEFQNKCLGKMQEVSKNDGRTVLFVSHNMGAIKNLCPQTLFLERGKVTMLGETGDVIGRYLSGDAEIDRCRVWEKDFPGGKDIRLHAIKILDEQSSIENNLTSASTIQVVIEYEILNSVKDLRVVVNFLTFDGEEIFSSSDFNYQGKGRIREAGMYTSILTIPPDFLNMSRYYVSVDIDIPRTESFVTGESVGFSIDELIKNELGITIAKKPSGIIHPVLNWNVSKS
ncbi:ABC transporter ATP-binding protein [Pseudoflavitalea sp. X16]|uniref:ABC transporter ATP-binding protein n=1 Tax=Paraflavitalea devenefica TaxID=2716334 RepID=UPI00141EBE5A|nr:ABC transporter ATP-binding protein [Paraflavitalea devenefica]NII24099.1 ABC transporter ATP-binding protein [Paraflavitalea devenefica]